ncbi:MAG: ribbon-helix-helix domain-containing protein [Thermoplasmatota archaeon]
MAPKTAKQPTDRITVRLPKNQIEQIGALVTAGRYRTTTDFIFLAVRDYLAAQGAGAKQTIEAEQGLLDIQKAVAVMEAARKLGLK